VANFFLSGYYGYDNAGDEAVLAAILEAISAQQPGATFTVTAGDTATTATRHNSYAHPIRAIGRQEPRGLLAGIKACDVFISGGGSLLQDITSLRNIVYYTTLIRLAQLARKPVMVYAQGIGPLLRPLSQKLTRVAVQRAKAVTVRDEDSLALLRRIGVRREIEVTADPVWALQPGSFTNTQAGRTLAGSLRPWPGYIFDPAEDPAIRNGFRDAAQATGAKWRYVPMQPEHDEPTMRPLLGEGDEVLDVRGLHPRDMMARCGHCDVMVAMRLHALIFAAAQGTPCVAVSYDPKVDALAKIIGAPLLKGLSASELARLPEAIAAARPMEASKLAQLQAAARRNAEIATSL
jgi:polysaccharide pyruvyl transferase CsaB